MNISFMCRKTLSHSRVKLFLFLLLFNLFIFIFKSYDLFKLGYIQSRFNIHYVFVFQSIKSQVVQKQFLDLGLKTTTVVFEFFILMDDGFFDSINHVCEISMKPVSIPRCSQSILEKLSTRFQEPTLIEILKIAKYR